GSRGGVTAVAFSPDGGLLAVGSADTTVLLFDVRAVAVGRPWPQVALEPNELPKLWDELGSENAPSAMQALWKLLGAPEEAIKFLQENWGKLAPVEQHLKKLLADVDSKKFSVRDKAAQDLAKYGLEGKPHLEKAIKENSALEVRLRLEKVLEKLAEHETGQRFRAGRVIQVLEYLGNPAARQILQSLARDASKYRAGQEAQRALDRMAGR